MDIRRETMVSSRASADIPQQGDTQGQVDPAILQQGPRCPDTDELPKNLDPFWRREKRKEDNLSYSTA
jgi:hypothetical protein